MGIEHIAHFELNTKLGQVRSVPVSMGKSEGEYHLFVYSRQGNIDPWCEYFTYPEDTLRMAMYSPDGQLVWKRDLGTGNIPGIWYVPFISFDLNNDGVDEIFYVNNANVINPFSMKFRYLECSDPKTGETIGQWQWPDNLQNESMSHKYRYSLMAGYAKSEPVLIASQGTYEDMFIQAYNSDMSLRWNKVIKKEDHGARASHICPVIDFNEDGIDELFWGERHICINDGHEILCCDGKKYRGHSDIVIPYVDRNTGKKYIFTCREDYEMPGEKRVVTYDGNGEVAWAAVDSGHMHKGWIANIGENYAKVAMAAEIGLVFNNNRITTEITREYYFDAVTGAEINPPFPLKGSDIMPVDIDGDGYHEFYGISGECKGYILDRKGNKLKYIGGKQITSGKICNIPGEQIMVFYEDEGLVSIWADTSAKESEVFKERHKSGYLKFMQHMMGNGYNYLNAAISCGI